MLFGDKETPSVFCKMSCHNEMGGDTDDICAVTLSGKKSNHENFSVTEKLRRESCEASFKSEDRTYISFHGMAVILSDICRARRTRHTINPFLQRRGYSCPWKFPQPHS